MGIVVSLGLMASLNAITWVRLIVWLIIGLLIYFTYSVKHSLVRHPELRKEPLTNLK
jgi:APA family basic amino acid/polyamine antiporter